MGEPHDAHVRAASKVFRDVGFTLHAMQFPRSERAIDALLAFNGLARPIMVPHGWRYYPNAAMKAWWEARL